VNQPITVAYAMVSVPLGACSTTFSPHLEKVVVPPPVEPVMTSLTGRVLDPEEIVKTLFVAEVVLDAAVFQVS